MTEEEREDLGETVQQEEEKSGPVETGAEEVRDVEDLKKDLSAVNDKYLRLYAEFENYRKTVAREKEELAKYSNEELMTALLSVIDHLELALEHTAGSDAPSSLAEGVELTLKELITTLEKFGLVRIEALGKPFDPFVHHAMTQIESAEENENMVIKEFRRGYMLRDRVLRAALVGVSMKPSKKTASEEIKEE